MIMLVMLIMTILVVAIMDHGYIDHGGKNDVDQDSFDFVLVFNSSPHIF